MIAGNKKKEKIHFLSFYTEGKDADSGFSLLAEAQILSDHVGEYFSSVIMRSPKSLIDQDKRWADLFKDRRNWVKSRYGNSTSGFRWNENWAAMNFLVWKPHIINRELLESNKINLGDILFYHDVNVTKYPDYLYGIKKWVGYIHSQMKGKSVLLFDDDGLPIQADCKRELIEKYQCEVFEKEGHTWAGAIAIRKDKDGLNFVSDWIKMVSDLDNVSPITNYGNRSGYIWHSQEQACLSILYFRNLNNPSVKKLFLYSGRRIPPPNIYKLRYFMRMTMRSTRKMIRKIFSQKWRL